MEPESLEHEARRLHQSIYGPSSDKDWNECKDIWIQNINWLRDNQSGGHYDRTETLKHSRH